MIAVLQYSSTSRTLDIYTQINRTNNMTMTIQTELKLWMAELPALRRMENYYCSRARNFKACSNLGSRTLSVTAAT